MGRWAQRQRYGRPTPVVPLLNFTVFTWTNANGGGHTIDTGWSVSVAVDNISMTLKKTSDNSVVSVHAEGGPTSSGVFNWGLLTVGVAYYVTGTFLKAGYVTQVLDTNSFTVV